MTVTVDSVAGSCYNIVMKYQFPRIENISEVLPIIANLPEFSVHEKDGGYTVVNYHVSMDTTFPPVQTAGGDAKMRETASREKAIRRELRGIIFETTTGNILHRRLHKFFNVNEREETRADKIDFSQPHVILEKLDGSMITPVMTTSGIRWGTKMGVTDVALPVEAFIVDHPQYVKFAHACHYGASTPIFEWCSRKQQIVVDYPEDKLVLVAIRHNKSGDYWTYDSMTEAANIVNIPVVKQFPGTAESMQNLIDACANLTEAEGFVVRFDDGHMVKVKGGWYVRLHRAKEGIRFEKNIIEMILSEKVDDVKPFLLESDRVRLEAFMEQFWAGVFQSVEMFQKLFESGYIADRRNFAVNFVLKQPRHLQGFLFEMHKGREILDVIKSELLLNVGSQTKVNELRWLHNANWIAVDE